MIANFFSGRLLETTLNADHIDDDDTAAAALFDDDDDVATADARSANDFVRFVSHADRRQCGPHDAVLAASAARRKAANAAAAASAAPAPIRLNCRPGHGNGTMLMINSYKDMLHLIAHHGNLTGRQMGKRAQPNGQPGQQQPHQSQQQQPGNCALLLFYAKTCYMSSKLAPQYNPLAHLFPDLRVGAIDAVRFHEMNTELGIVGLPTLMLFHQARPVVRFNGTLSRTSTNFQTISDFVTEHTGIVSRLRAEPSHGEEPFALRSEHFAGPLDGVLVVESDWCLWLAWLFIGVCCCYGFGRTSVYAKLVEYVKRNWRESGAD